MPDRDTRWLEARLDSFEDKLTQIVKRQDHLDDCFDRRMRDLNESVEKMVEAATSVLKARLQFPERVAWMVVGTVMTGVVAALLTMLFNVGGESKRLFTAPTAPYQERTK